MSSLCEVGWSKGTLQLPVEQSSWGEGWKQHWPALVPRKIGGQMACASLVPKRRLKSNPWAAHIKPHHCHGLPVDGLGDFRQRRTRSRFCQPIRASQDDPANPPQEESTSQSTPNHPEASVGLDSRVLPTVNHGPAASSQEQRQRHGFGTRLRRQVNKRAAKILHTFKKEEKLKMEYATEEEEMTALTEQRYKLASGLKRTLLRIGICFVVLAVVKILNSLREALLVTPVDYMKLLGVLSSLDYWALAFLVFDIRNTIIEIEKNDGDGDPTVRVLEQENVAIGISFEKFFKRMFKVLSAIAFAQVLGVLSVTGFQLAPNVDNGLRQLWGFVSPHL